MFKNNLMIIKRFLNNISYLINDNFFTFLFVFIVTFLTSTMSYNNMDEVKNNAESKLVKMGFIDIKYAGYSIGFGLPLSSYGGAYVDYIANDTTGTKYKVTVYRWGNEYHIRSLHALNAISPSS